MTPPREPHLDRPSSTSHRPKPRHRADLDPPVVDHRGPERRLRGRAETVAVNTPVTVQFSAASETVNVTAGTFSIPVAVTPTVSTFASGFSDPQGLAFDAAGNLYVANDGNNTVSKVTPAGVVSTFASGFNGPDGLAFDAAGNLYVANENGNTVSKVTPAGVVSTFASGFNLPSSLAFDAVGNLYVTNIGTVSKVTPAGVVSTFASGLSGPTGLAFDPAGNLYVSNGNSNTVSKVTPAGVVSTFASGFSGAEAWPSTPPATSTSPTAAAAR